MYRLTAFLASVGEIDAADRAKLNGEIAALEAENPPNTLKDLAVTGEDLMQMGITGRKIGETLRYVLDLVLRDEAENNREVLLSRIGEVDK